MPSLIDSAKHTQQMGRRRFLAATGLTSSLMLEPNCCEAVSVDTHKDHQIVKVILPGGPSQIDLWDLKPNAVKEIRGSFRPISTQVVGVQISECLPQIAMMMERFTIVRAISGSMGSHDLTQVETGLGLASTGVSNNATTFQEAEALLSAGHSDIILKFGSWDHHQKLDHAIGLMAQQLDQQLSDFIQSLADTGRLEQTTVLVWGEFGRSPRINMDGGRDHWPVVNSALIAGGLATRGNVWGSTSDDGSHIIDPSIDMNKLVHECSQSPFTGLA
ncbi:MAG: DUF1501 domain-containing protein [Fuerstiella sp.]